MRDPRGDDYFGKEIQPAMEVARKDWLEKARATAAEIAARAGTVTADDVHVACPLPDGLEPRTMGAVFRTKQFHLVGYTAGVRSVRAIGIYALRSPDA